MDSTLEWYLTMQRKWKARDSSKKLDWNYTYIFARGGGLYCFDGEDFVMVFDVTRYANKNGRMVAEGLTHMGTLRGPEAASFLAELRRDLSEE
jgi:hypothetical protein